MKLTRRALGAWLLAAPLGSSIAQPAARVPRIGVLSLNRAASEVAQFEAAALRKVLHDAVPRATRVAMLVNSAEPGTPLYLAENHRAASAMGLTTEVVDLAGHASLAAALQRAAASRPDALFVGNEGLAGTQLGEIAAFAQRNRLPAIGVTPQFVHVGGAMYDGPNLPSLAQRSASDVARILAGAQPGELPMELPTKYDLVINRKALSAIGVSGPAWLLLRADEVIE